jgi:gliding motility-associated-like protein
MQMKALKTIVFILLAQSIVDGQNLCGYWIGYGYTCLDKQSNLIIVPYELIYIFQNGDSLKAIKIIGDDCVTSGQVTWEGTLVRPQNNIINARIQFGYPDSPNLGFQPTSGKLIPPDSILIATVRFRKINCAQAKALGANLLDKRYNCDCSNTDICKIDIPNAFTPNEDGINDTFSPITICQLSEYNMKIFNRWGNLVFETNDIQTEWRGMAKDKPLPSDTYMWILNATTLNGKPITQSGEITLVR